MVCCLVLNGPSNGRYPEENEFSLVTDILLVPGSFRYYPFIILCSPNDFFLSDFPTKISFPFTLQQRAQIRICNIGIVRDFVPK
jgi:hypothetical protein